MSVTLGRLLGWLFRTAPREQNAHPSVASKVNPLSDLTTMMGARTSDGAPDTAVSLTSDLKPVTESLWELYSPPEGEIEAEIIFFHGLPVGDSEEAYWETWLSTDRTVIWPKEWLKTQCKGARVLSVSYNSSARIKEEEDTPDMYVLGENLVSDIIVHGECGQEPWRPVILVGHCLGGIVVKQFILSAFRMKNQSRPNETQFEKINNFLNNFKGVYYYATPHQGSGEIERWAENLKAPSSILDLLRRLSSKTQRINDEFRRHRSNINAKAFAVCETHKTDALGFKGIVVGEASARHDIDSFYSSKADHFSICRASNAKDSTVIGKLAMFTNDILKAEKKAKQEADQERRFQSLQNFQQFPRLKKPRSAANHTTW